jgi:hypothetical protein
MSAQRFTARNLATAFLAGPWTREGLTERGAEACGGGRFWLAPLVRRVLTVFATPPAASAIETLTDLVEGSRAFWGRPTESVRRLFWLTPEMTTHPGPPSSWPVPALATTGALAEWLGVRPNELDWFADCQGRLAAVPDGPLRHYTYRWLRQRSGKTRLLEVPRPRLKALQRRVLHGILDQIPAHAAAHGYRRGRSLATYVAPHTGRRIVLRMDLRNFFPSVRAARVHALFRTAGYPAGVARLLTGLCTNVVPYPVLCAAPEQPAESAAALRRALGEAHLPQGAPTSPALANLCAHRLDCRLAALAEAAGASYTRYADDLAFSGGRELERAARRFHVAACRVALEEGFEVHPRKTRFMRQALRQQLAGVVVNAHANLSRTEYDRLKATLHNCVRHGPASQNREGRGDFRAHLAGRVAYCEWLNPARGRRLRSLFERISWDESVGQGSDPGEQTSEAEP